MALLNVLYYQFHTCQNETGKVMEKITSCLYMYEYEKYTAQEQKKKIGPRPAATYSTHLEKENENI